MNDPVPAHGYAAAPTGSAPIVYTPVGADQYPQQQPAAAAAAPAPPPPPAEPPGQHNADLRAEVFTELDVPNSLAEFDGPGEEVRVYPDGAIAVALVGAEGRRDVVHILPTDEWPSDANSAMHVGDYESWADGCLALDDYDRIWCDLRPNIGQIKTMFVEYRQLTGQDAGKSSASPRALRRQGRR